MTIPKAVRERVREAARRRCGYCLVEERYVYALYELEHITPRSRGGTDDESNLWLAGPICNRFKGDQIDAVDPQTGRRAALYNPRRQRWGDHFHWADDRATIIGLTACGRATIAALQMNYAPSVELRRLFVQAGWYPPE